MITIFGDDFVAGTVKTDGIAKRQMEIQRQRSATLIGKFSMLQKLLCLEGFIKFQRGRIRGISGAGCVVFLNKLAVHDQLILHNKRLVTRWQMIINS